MNNIEILEDWLKEMDEHFKRTHINNTKEREALRFIIQENKELKEVLEKISKDLDNIAYDQIPIEMQRAFGKEYDLGYRQGWYNAEEDWKLKVKEKIEKLNYGERIKFYTEDKKHYYETNSFNEAIKYVLQELLEGEQYENIN